MSTTIIRRVNDETVIITNPRGPMGLPGEPGPAGAASTVPGPPGTNGTNGVNGTNGTNGAPGVNGGIGSSAGFSGLFAAASGMTIGAGITRAHLAGNAVAGVGAAWYNYDAAVTSGTVTANPRTQFLAADGRGFKLDHNQYLTPQMFGDLTTATGASAAYKAAAEYQLNPAASRASPIQHVGVEPVTLSETLEPNGVFNIQGNAGGLFTGGSAVNLISRIIGPINQTTIRFRCISEGLVKNASKANSGGSLIRGVKIEQEQSGGLPGTDRTAHGIHAKGTPFLEHIVLQNIAGDGVNITADSGSSGAAYGNANQWLMYRVSVQTAEGNGFCIGRLNGLSGSADVNAGLALGIHVHDVERAGILDRSFYPNTFIAPLINKAGNRGVSWGGKRWQLNVESNTGTEPGTETLNVANVWYELKATATVDLVNYPVWDPATEYFNQLYILSSQSTFITPYAENQFGYSHCPSGIVIGGNMAWTQHTARMGRSGPGISCNLAFGHERGTSGDVGHPAFAQIGSRQYTYLGFPASGDANFHKRAEIISHVCADSAWKMLYQNDVGGVFRDIIIQSNGIATLSWSGKGTARTYGRSAPVENMLTLHDYALQQAGSESENSRRIFGIRSTAPAYSNQAVGEAYRNVNPSGGILEWVVKTVSVPLAKHYLNERSSPTVGVGYVTGAGGAVTQATSKATGVTLDTVCGAITLNAASLAADTVVSFNLSNSNIAVGDVIVPVIKSGATAGAYVVQVDTVASGVCKFSIRNMTGGALAEALVLNFAIIKAVAA